MNWGRETENSIKGEHGYVVARFRVENETKFIPYRWSRMLSRVALDNARDAMEICENNLAIEGPGQRPEA